MTKKRVMWVDIVKVFALIYIVTEHFIQSMQKSGFMPENNFWLWIDTICAWVMVQMFFFCSGYLHQKQSKVNSLKSYGEQMLKKLWYLGLPYFFFSFVTILMKLVAENDVNQSIQQSIPHILFAEPIPPYWFIYVLFILFAISLPIRGKKSLWIQLIIALAMYALYVYGSVPYIIWMVCRYQIWFFLGMTVAYKDWLEVFPKWTKYVSLLFIPTSAVIFMRYVRSEWTIFAMGLWAALMLLLWARFLDTKWRDHVTIGTYLQTASKFIMPVFLMQTIFAAGFRIVCLKMGITLPIIHIICGWLITFIGPCITAVIYGKAKAACKTLLGGKK